jgi:cytochrome c-type biogenesis protein CcmH/NrfG
VLGDFESSLLDIRQTLILEPRHFGALSGLSMIFEATEQYERAIQTEQQLLNLMPNNELIEQRILRLQGKALKSRI